MAEQNPYVMAQAVDTPGRQYPGARKLDLRAMAGFVFTNPHWPTNVLWGALSLFLSSLLLPQIVFSGYLWETLEALHRGETKSYPDFNANRLGDYLKRGIWPFLVILVASLGIIAVIAPIWGLGILGVVVAATQLGEVAAVVAGGLLLILLFALSASLQLVLIPLLLRAGLSQDFSTAFDYAWVRQFIALTWRETLWGGLVLSIVAFAAQVVGLALCCVGIYPLVGMLLLAVTHFHWQLYEIFLDRGGKPVPLKARLVAPLPPPPY